MGVFPASLGRPLGLSWGMGIVEDAEAGPPRTGIVRGMLAEFEKG